MVAVIPSETYKVSASFPGQALGTTAIGHWVGLLNCSSIKLTPKSFLLHRDSFLKFVALELDNDGMSLFIKNNFDGD
jgi:hypothetical protein